MTKKVVFIGIDPDLIKSGVALVTMEPFKPKQVVSVHSLPFFDLLEFIEKAKRSCEQEGARLQICLEGGWLNQKSNWHPEQGPFVRERIAKNVGENHAVGKLIYEWLQRHEYPFKLIKPTAKVKKWGIGELIKITRYEGRTNEDQRDAIRACFLA